MNLPNSFRLELTKVYCYWFEVVLNSVFAVFYFLVLIRGETINYCLWGLVDVTLMWFACTFTIYFVYMIPPGAPLPFCYVLRCDFE